MTSSCSTTRPPATVESVDLNRFMGPWFVHSGLLTALEKDIYQAVESYELSPKGHIQTTYRFRKGGFDGPEKVYRPVGFVKNKESNAEWRMQFFWPIRLPYYILYLDPDYQVTAIGTKNRKYLWIMAREVDPPEPLLEAARNRVRELGYDLSSAVLVPNRVEPSAPSTEIDEASSPP